MMDALREALGLPVDGAAHSEDDHADDDDASADRSGDEPDDQIAVAPTVRVPVLPVSSCDAAVRSKIKLLVENRSALQRDALADAHLTASDPHGRNRRSRK